MHYPEYFFWNYLFIHTSNRKKFFSPWRSNFCTILISYTCNLHSVLFEYHHPSPYTHNLDQSCQFCLQNLLSCSTNHHWKIWNNLQMLVLLSQPFLWLLYDPETMKILSKTSFQPLYLLFPCVLNFSGPTSYFLCHFWVNSHFLWEGVLADSSMLHFVNSNRF